jgi:uncharacterized FlaG/YvyC family protein
MSVEFGPLSGVGRAYAVASQAPARAGTQAEPAESVRRLAHDTVELSQAATAAAREAEELALPETPPAEALAAVDRAAQRVEELAAEGRELHFSYNEQARRVVVEVRSLEGDVIRTIPPASAFEVLAGAELS